MCIHQSRTQTYHRDSMGGSKLDLYTFLRRYVPYKEVEEASARMLMGKWVLFVIRLVERIAIATTYPSVPRFCKSVWHFYARIEVTHPSSPRQSSTSLAHNQIWNMVRFSSLHLSPAQDFSVTQIRNVLCTTWRANLIRTLLDQICFPKSVLMRNLWPGAT